jgi:predicted MFS family arabinose efflux permease
MTAFMGFVVAMSGICATIALYYYDVVPIDFVLVAVLILMFVSGLGLVAFNVPLGLVMQRKVRKDMLGKVSAVTSTLSQALIPIASLLAGFVIARAGNQVFFIAAALGMIAVSAWFLPNKASNQI